MAVAYIMSTTNLSWKEALKVVRVGRSIANPNVGFQQQLKDFESSRLQDVSDTKIITAVFYLVSFLFSLAFFPFLSERSAKLLSSYFSFFFNIVHLSFRRKCHN